MYACAAEGFALRTPHFSLYTQPRNTPKRYATRFLRRFPPALPQACAVEVLDGERQTWEKREGERRGMFAQDEVNQHACIRALLVISMLCRLSAVHSPAK